MTDERVLRQVATADLAPAEVAVIRDLLWAAFDTEEHGGFSEDDWQHSIGGTHFIAEVDGRIVTHASVVPRTLYVGNLAIRTGYVEAVATVPEHQRRGHGSAVMRAVNELIWRDYELGALGTGSQAFYQRLGWQIWRGPTFVRTSAGKVRTLDDDGGIMVLLTPATPPIDLTEPIACEWRTGDVW